MPCNQNWSCYPCIMVCEYSYYEFDIKSMHIKIYACAILGTRAIKCMLYQSFEIMQNSFFMFVVWRCVWICVECVCEVTSIFVYANSPWTLVSMKIIKIGMACTVVYTPCYHYCAIVFPKAILNTVWNKILCL